MPNSKDGSFVWGEWTYKTGYEAYIRSIHLENHIFFLKRITKEFEDELASLRHEVTDQEVQEALESIGPSPLD